MSKRVAFELPKDKFDELHRALDRTRQTSRTVTVERQSLMSLLVDHSRLLLALQAQEAE